MNIFVDFHHGGLYESLRLLFEVRLGHHLYRPIGEEWFTSGFWKLAEPYGNHPDTIKQFLSRDSGEFSPFKNLNGINRYEDEIYHIIDPLHKTSYKAITLDKFKEMDIDIVISSYAPHDEPFTRLVKQFKPKAKLISQMGNIFQTTEINNVLCSTNPYPVPEGKNVVFYHQEFNLDLFKPKDIESNLISSFVNLLPRPDLFNQYKSALTEFDFKSYGIGCPDGTIQTLEELSDIMRNSKFGWHIKPEGDGFGHVIHNWYACGKPVIINASDYYGKLADYLLEDGVTCIDLEQRSVGENIAFIRKMSEPENYIKLCQNAYSRFKQVVDFDEEEKKIRIFLDKLL